jgi:hypothetical protein
LIIRYIFIICSIINIIYSSQCYMHVTPFLLCGSLFVTKVRFEPWGISLTDMWFFQLVNLVILPLTESTWVYTPPITLRLIAFWSLYHRCVKTPAYFKGPLKGVKYNKKEIKNVYPFKTHSHEIHVPIKLYPAYKMERRLLAKPLFVQNSTRFKKQYKIICTWPRGFFTYGSLYPSLTLTLYKVLQSSLKSKNYKLKNPK